MTTSFPPVSSTLGNVDLINDLRARMFDLQRQLGTGQRSETYGGLGTSRTTALSLNAQRSSLLSYQDAIATATVRFDLLDNNLNRLVELGQETKGDALGEPYNPGSDGLTISQITTRQRLDEAIVVLNTRVDNRFLFSGRAIDTEPVESLDRILDGDGTRIGLRDYVDERQAADFGTGSGRLTTGSTATAVTIAEDGAHPFGFKLDEVATTITGAVSNAPTGSPATASIDLGTNQPAPGDTARFKFTLPDGSSTEIVLAASDSTPLEANEFAIGANVTASASNIQAALDLAIANAAVTELSAASTIAASQSFFAGSTANPPQRVNGPPATATGFIAGTPDNTVIWYKGEDVTGVNVRGLATAEVDDGLNVRYGTSAQEEGIRNSLAYMAAFSIESFDPSVDTDRDRFNALAQRVGSSLDFPPGAQSVADIQTEIALANLSAQSANTRHGADLAVLDQLRDDIQGVDENAVGVELLALETQLSITYEATALISQLNLADFI